MKNKILQTVIFIILGLFDILPTFPSTKSETMRNDLELSILGN